MYVTYLAMLIILDCCLRFKDAPKPNDWIDDKPRTTITNVSPAHVTMRLTDTRYTDSGHYECTRGADKAFVDVFFDGGSK